MGEWDPPPSAVLPVLFVDGDQTVDLGTVTVQPSLGVRKLHAVIADRVGLAPRPTRSPPPSRAPGARAASPSTTPPTSPREGAGCYVLAALRRSSRRERRSRRDKKKASPSSAAAPPPPPPPDHKTILKRLPPTDLAAAPLMLGAWDYEAQLRELQRRHDWYVMSTAAADPYFPLTASSDLLEVPPRLWSPRPPCPDCEAAAAAMREPPFHWCVRDAVTVGFRSHVGPIERPPKKSPSPPPPLPNPGRLPGYFGLPVY